MKYLKKFIHIICISLVLALGLSFNLPSPVFAAAGTAAGTLTLTPTIENIGVICSFTGDDDGDNSALLEYRVSGGSWMTAPAMWKDTRTSVTTDKNGNTVTNPYANTYRGSIFWLTTNTQYEVRVTFTDADGVSGTNPVTGTVTTWNDNPPSSGTAYYVATTGSDTAAGTEAAPFKTINKAAGMVAAGSTVYIKAGTYNEQINMSLISGSATNFITFRAYGTDSVILNGGFSIDRCSYIRIKGLTIQNTSMPIYIYNTLYPAHPENNPRGCIIEDCTVIVSGTGNDSCIRIAYGAGGVIVQRNTLTVNVATAIGDKSGIYVWNTDGNNVYRNNQINGKPYDGIGGGPENELGHMSNMDVYNNIINGAPDDGIQIDGDNCNTRIYNNVVSGGSFDGISTCPVILGPSYIFRNVLYDFFYRDTAGNSQGLKLGDGALGRQFIYHNTIYCVPNGGDGPFATNAGLGNIVSRNNVYYAYRYVIEFGHTADNSPVHSFDYDLLYTIDTGRFIKYPGTTYTFAQFQAYGQETHGLSANVAGDFNNAAGGDFTLKSTSQLINKGVVLPGFNDANSPWPYSGTAPDIGAYEYGSSAPPSNTAPVAVADSYTTAEDTALTVAAPGVLSNDTDADGNTLTAVKVTNPSHGAVTLNSNGSFTYTPTANYNGADSFTYKANDGTADSNTVTVSLTVTAVNDTPTAVNDSYSTNKDTALTVAAPGVLSNDTDADGNTLTAVKVANPSHGAVTLNSNGSFTYTPTANYTGADSFTYKANDGSLDSNTASVSITVSTSNTSPVAVADSYTTAEDTALTTAAPGVLSNDTDTDGNTLTAVKVTNPAHGAVTLNSNGSFTYTPTANYNGADSFTYKANDGTADSNTVTVSLTVTAVNDAPTAANDAYSTIKNTPLNVVTPGVLFNDSDIDSANLTAIKVTDPSHGTVTLNSNGSFTYTPTANYTGADSFTYKANDGSLDSNTASVSITVSTSNTAPVAVADSYSTAEDTALTVAAPGVLSNDTDADGNTLTAVKVTNPAHGAVTLNSNGSFTYTPTANYNGADSFTYKANDGIADSNTITVSLTVTVVNDAPTASNDSYSTTKNTALTVAAPGVLSNDTDVDSANLTAVKVANPSHGAVTLNSNGSLTYTPTANYTGADSFTYKANDGSLDSNTATVSITVSTSNTAPVAVADSYTAAQDTALTVNAPGVLSNDTDGDGNTLTAVKVTNPSHGAVTLNSNGSFTYTPASGYAGMDAFNYQANDNQANSNIITVNITVEATPSNPIPAGGGGGGGGGGSGSGGSGAPGITNLRGSITNAGVMMEDAQATDIYLKVEVRISKGSIVKNKAGQPATSILIAPVSSTENTFAANAGSKAISETFSIALDGTTFSPAATLIFRYPAWQIPSDIPLTNLFIATWDESTLSWKDLGGKVDTNTGTVSTPIQHLSSYALMAHTRPADIKVTGLTLSSDKVNTGETVTAHATLCNQGDLAGTYVITFTMDNAAVETKEVTLNGGTDETISFSLSPAEVGAHIAGAGDIRASFVVKNPVTPATFTVDNLNIAPLQVNSGEKITISAVVKNIGSSTGVYQTVLTLDDVTAQTREITLNGGEAVQVNFSFTPDTVGIHKAGIGDLLAPFEVKAQPLLPPLAGGQVTKLEISSFGIAPVIDPSTQMLLNAKISYQMNSSMDFFPGARLMLTVFQDSQFLEQVPLTLAQNSTDGKTGELSYIPSAGWETGDYSFRAELYQGESLVQDTPIKQLTLALQRPIKEVSWKTLGIIIGAAILASIVILSLVLYYRRDMMRY